jgi:epsilon-lactone hydrolase
VIDRAIAPSVAAWRQRSQSHRRRGGPRSYGVAVAGVEVDVVNELLRSMTLSGLTLDEQRAAMHDRAGTLLDGLEVATVDADGVECEWITPPEALVDRTIVSLRGGGYCVGSLITNRRFCGLLADVTGIRVLNVGYRNAPEHPFPAALDDTTRAYRWLLTTGAAPTTIGIVGNSAGGGLAVAALLALRDAGDPLPAAAVALSPWADLAATGRSLITNADSEVMLDPAGVTDTASLYADRDQLRHPLVSPLYGDLRGLPPLLVQASTTEILRDDAVRLVASARAAGVEATIDLVDGMPHVWHLFAGTLAATDDSLLDLAIWLTERLA